MTHADALHLFQSRTGLIPDPIDFRNMLDEETEIVLAAGLVGRPRNRESLARDRAAENLIAWCIDGPRLEFGKTMATLAAFIASHRRPAIWAALVGYKKTRTHPSELPHPPHPPDPSDPSESSVSPASNLTPASSSPSD